MTKHALVVDDSKLARIVLKNMLTERGITVDTAESAEEALGYLCKFRPDVIFMDHIMPGMDGLQAVQAIKEDPATAMIPILMYTSKEGEVYMSQARALGAVGVLPKQLKPVDLEMVLSRLRLLPGQKPVINHNDDFADKAHSVGMDDGENSALDQLAQKAHDATIGLSIRNTVKKMLASNNLRMRKEFRLVALEIAETLNKSQKTGRWLGLATVCGLFLLQAAWFSYQNQQLAIAVKSTADELAQLKKNSIPKEPPKQRVAMISQSSAMQHNLSPELPSWLMDRDDSIEFGEIPFGNEQLHTLSKLITHLENKEYKGTLRIVSHVGEFCVQVDDQNNVLLPVGSSNIANCSINVYGRYEAHQLGLRQSDSFAQFIQEHRDNNTSCIDIEIATEGQDNPLFVYPDYYQIETAQEWNQVARLNNRVEYELLPAGRRP